MVQWRPRRSFANGHGSTSRINPPVGWGTEERHSHETNMCYRVTEERHSHETNMRYRVEGIREGRGAREIARDIRGDKRSTCKRYGVHRFT